MVHPVFVHHAQHDHPLELTHQGRAVGAGAEGLFARVIDGVRHLLHPRGHGGGVRLLQILDLHIAAAQEQPLKGFERFVELLLVLGVAAREAVGHRGAHELLQHAADLALQVLAVQHLPSLAVDDLALLVHDVVVFQDVLTGLEVAAFNGFLGLLDGAGEHLGVQRGVLIHLEAVHHAHDALRAEEAHDIVRHGEVEAALAGVALTSASAAELVVDAAGFVPLGAQDEEAAHRADLFGLGGGHFLMRRHALAEEGAGGGDGLVVGIGKAGGFGDHGVVVPRLAQVVLREVFGVAAQHDIGAAAGHIRRDGHGTQLAGLGDDLGFLLVILGVQDGMGHAAPLQQGREILALLNRDGTDQDRLALLVAGADLVDDGLVLADVAAVDHIRPVLTDDRLVGGDLDDVKLVDRGKLLGFGHGRAGHAGELVIEAEIVLESDGGEGLVLLLNVDVLLGLDGLVEALGIAAAQHQAAGELIDDDDLAVLDDIVDVALHDAVGTQGLIDMVAERGVFHVGQVLQPESPLRLRDTAGGEGRGARLLIDDIVRVQVLALLFLLVDGGIDHLLQAAHKVVRLAVEVRALVPLAGDDQRRARFIDQDGVDLVDDGEGVAALDHVFLIQGHVVAQIVETHLVVGAVGDVAGIGASSLLIGQAVDDQAHVQAEEAVYLSHPLAVAAGQIVVHRDDVNAFAGQGIEVGRKDGDQGFAFTGLHLGNAPLVEHDAADDLDREGLHPQHAPGRLARRGERVRKNVVQGLALREAFFQFFGFMTQLLIGEPAVFLFPCLDRFRDGHDAFQFSVGIASKQF